MTSGGREVDVGGGGEVHIQITYKTSSSSASTTAWTQVYCTQLGTAPSPPTSTLRLPDAVHMIHRFLVFCALPPPCIILNTNRRTRKWGSPGNEAISQAHHSIQHTVALHFQSEKGSYVPHKCIRH